MGRMQGRQLFGLILILLGSIWALKNLNVFSYEFEYLFLSWPFILIVIGLIIIIRSGGSFGGFVLILVGGAFFYSRAYHYPVGEIFRDFWPVILIAVGLSILFGHNRDKGQKRDKIETDTGSVTDEYFDISSIFNDIKRKIESPSVKGGKVTTIFGGAKIDLYNTSPQEKCVIDVLTVFGGTEIFAPADWKISNNVTAVFGGAEDKRRKSAPVAGEEKKLIITGSAIFGGLEIKS